MGLQQAHQEIVRRDPRISYDTWESETKFTDIEGEVLVDKEASDRYRANTIRAQYLSSDRPGKQTECRDLTPDATAIEPCSSSKNVSHDSNPGVIQTKQQAVSELGRMFLLVR